MNYKYITHEEIQDIRDNYFPSSDEIERVAQQCETFVSLYEDYLTDRNSEYNRENLLDAIQDLGNVCEQINSAVTQIADEKEKQYRRNFKGGNK